MSHIVGSVTVWKKEGKTFFTCTFCRLEHEMSARSLVSDKLSASGYSVKLESADGRWATIPLSEITRKAPWLLEGIQNAS